jgi:hypothetical protein
MYNYDKMDSRTAVPPAGIADTELIAIFQADPVQAHFQSSCS